MLDRESTSLWDKVVIFELTRKPCSVSIIIPPVIPNKEKRIMAEQGIQQTMSVIEEPYTYQEWLLYNSPDNYTFNIKYNYGKD